MIAIETAEQRRRGVIDALRRGTGPQRSFDAFAVGIQPFRFALA